MHEFNYDWYFFSSLCFFSLPYSRLERTHTYIFLILPAMEDPECNNKCENSLTLFQIDSLMPLITEIHTSVNI